MRNILLFEKYIESIYEVDLSDKHYLSRASLNHINSRILPYSPNNRYGFEVKGFVDHREKIYNNINQIIDLLDIDKKIMDDYISNILYLLTNSQKLKKWNSGNKSFYKMLNLGRICFKYNDERFYPLIAGGMGTEEDDFYDYGDRIWVFTKEEGEGEDMAKTVKYYAGDLNGKNIMMNRSYRDALKDNPGMSRDEFYKMSLIEDPYGVRFQALIDFDYNDPIEDRDIILQNIKTKIERS